MSDRRFRLDPDATPVDPWPSAPFVPGYAHDGLTRSFPASPPIDETQRIVGETRREVHARPYSGKRGDLFGYVYELVLTGQPTIACTYIGKTEQTMAERMSTSGSGHRSPTSIARDPWKARIAPGKAGYRILERVRCTGEGYDADRRALLRAEADWIDRRRPVENDVRPVRPRGEAPKRERVSETRRETKRVPVRRRSVAEARARRRMIGTLVLAALLIVALTRVTVGMDLTWPWWGQALFVVTAAVFLAVLLVARWIKFTRKLGRR